MGPHHQLEFSHSKVDHKTRQNQQPLRKYIRAKSRDKCVYPASVS